MFLHSNGDVSPDVSGGLLDKLNDEQRAAVALPAEHALILAGAGSGKTRVLTTRIAWLLHTGQVSPGGLLAVTFTNKAAKEMLTRLSAMLPIQVRGMWIGTFHGLCNRFLRAHHKLANLPATFQILDTQDQLSAVKRVMKAAGVDEERFPPKQMQWFIAGCKEEGMRPAAVPVRDADTRRKVEIYQLYEDQCQREGVVDFGELMLRSYELLRDNDPVREHYRRRFRHILIDEFQDTNRLQYAWIKMFAPMPASGERQDNCIFAVGDDDQSIYAFRGARVGNMADFVREYDVAHQIKLEQNYRSHGNILDSANELIGHNRRRLGKNLRTDQGPGEPVRVFEAPSDLAEAQWMVDEIRQLTAPGSGLPRRELALLYRSNAQSRVLETALFQAGLPYRVYGGLRFFERAEIKHALAYLRLLENPHDDTSFLRVVNFPARGIGARTIEQLQDLARAADGGRGASLYRTAGTMSGKAGANLAGFVARVDVMREQSEGRSLRETIQLVLDQSGLIDHYRAEREGAERIENLEELVNAAESFVTLEGFGRDATALPLDEWSAHTGLTQSPSSQGLDVSDADPADSVRAELMPAPDSVSASLEPAIAARPPAGVLSPDGETLSPLAAFLTHAALESGDNQAQAGEDAVQLMTVHAAKGLEFDVVFISGLEEGLFPHDNSLSDADGLEEERRLMYVAITRARHRLYLSHSQTRLLHGQTRYNVRSRFFDELPESALKWLAPKVQALRPSWSSADPLRSLAAGARSDSLSRTLAQAAAPAGSASVRVGQRVFHGKFGEGKVLAVEGRGADARAHVHFNRHGPKWLALAVAKLEAID